MDVKKRAGGLMRIVIDGRMINESGIGRYLRNLIDQLQILDNKNEYFILHLKEDYDTSMYQSNFKKVLADFKWYTLKEQIELPKILRKINPDLTHFPHFNVPILYSGKFIVTIHDLIHQHYSMERDSTHGKLIFNVKKFGYKKVFGAAIKKSSKILVPSNFVKTQLINEWGIKDGKIIVTPEAVDPDLIGVDESLLKKTEKLPEGVKSPYILYVGNVHPHKNIEALIKAFLILRENYKNLPLRSRTLPLSKDKSHYLQLVLTGKENYFWKVLRLASLAQDKNIIFTGFVSDEQLVALYKNAKAYVEPSVEEGFGLPILEAFAAGCPVVSSDIGSLKEVGGNAAVYFNPLSVEDIVEKISSVLSSEQLSKELVEKGKKRVKEFSWKKMAEQTLEVYESSNRS